MSKVIVYCRVSTDKQETAQQMRTVNEWLDRNRLTATSVISDEGVSGGVSYKERKLGKEVIPELSHGDTLVVAELSRLGRSMSDISKLVNDELKPRGVRLVIVQMGVDLDCSHMKAINEMILLAFSFAAQMEKELIKERTQSAIDVRKKKLETDGAFISKKGRVCERLGNPTEEGIRKASDAAARAKREKAANDPNNIALWSVLQPLAVNGNPPTTESLKSAVVTFAERDLRTQTGKTINVARARSCYHTLKKIFA